MKQVILAAGKGTRLKLPVTNKCLATVSGKTLIDHNLELSSEINASEIIIIVGYNKEPLIENIGSSYNGIPIKYVEQEPQLGEYEMGDWIRSAIQRGMSCYAFEIGNADFNINEISDLKKAEEYINKEV